MAWDEGQTPSCPRCGLARDEVGALLSAACGALAAARRGALRGDFATAREQMELARALGLDAMPLGREAWRRLDALCAAALGEWSRIDDLALLPVAWRSAVSPDSPVWSDYEAARKACARGDWRAARVCAARCASAAPWLLPARTITRWCDEADKAAVPLPTKPTRRGYGFVAVGAALATVAVMVVLLLLLGRRGVAWRPPWSRLLAPHRRRRP